MRQEFDVTRNLTNEDYHEVAMTHLLKVGDEYVNAVVTEVVYSDNDYVTCTLHCKEQLMIDKLRQRVMMEERKEPMYEH